MTRMQKEQPIARVVMPYGSGTCWLVTRYADVQLVTSDRRFSRAALAGKDFPRITPAPIAQSEAINLMDPPVLARIRRLVTHAFGPRQIDRLRPWVQATVDDCLAEMAASAPQADVVSQLSERLPLATICELLGIPLPDRPQLRTWATAMMDMTPHGRAAATQAKQQLRAYFDALAVARRASPGEDLLSELAVAQIGTETLTEAELAVMAMLLTVTGHDTTTYDISNIVFTLLTHPAQLGQLRARPQLLDQAIEELLRYIPFRQGVGIPRVALENVTIDGVTIEAGDTVHVSYLTANRDDLVYDRPDEIDFERPSPPAHMAFGYGMHHCLGSHLARLMLRTSIGTLLTRFPALHLSLPVEEVRWNTQSIWRYPLALPVQW
ncbi:cytochrome P450 [Streptomyces microflavus]|uniref:Cytochrome P450 n=1 Tax=Streptomyces microflavus TaxID=1919 RepID=A0A7H8N0H6_STRMI|nr:cytochrome P450 [Streptomyces microflavus]QKW47912.1 cytochrome P450 [Streptomyces microflavus]